MKIKSEIIEEYKLIALFMGLEVKKNYYSTGRKYEVYKDLDKLRYESHWGNLMEVVERINSIHLISPSFSKCNVIIRSMVCEIIDGSVHNHHFHIDVYDGFHQGKYTTQTAIYTAVLEFIKWFNNNIDKVKEHEISNTNN